LCNSIRIGMRRKEVGSNFPFAAVEDAAAASATNMLSELERGLFKGKKLAYSCSQKESPER
jgi:hypothetical protein